MLSVLTVALPPPPQLLLCHSHIPAAVAAMAIVRQQEVQDPVPSRWKLVNGA